MKVYLFYFVQLYIILFFKNKYISFNQHIYIGICSIFPNAFYQENSMVSQLLIIFRDTKHVIKYITFLLFFIFKNITVCIIKWYKLHVNIMTISKDTASVAAIYFSKIWSHLFWNVSLQDLSYLNFCES